MAEMSLLFVMWFSYGSDTVFICLFLISVAWLFYGFCVIGGIAGISAVLS